MIVKVQRSLFDSEGRAMVLVYDQDYKFTYNGPATPELLAALGVRLKGYFEAEVKDSKIVLLRPVDEQHWSRNQISS